MGNCCVGDQVTDLPVEFDYKNPVKLDIKNIYGSLLENEPDDDFYTLPGPSYQNSISAFLSNLPFKVSGCIIPGLDFRAGQKKVCQDGFSFLVYNNTLLAVLCDGHGPEGHHISKYSIEYIEKSFKKHFTVFKHDPKPTINLILQKCDNKIIKNLVSDVSGTTVLVIFISEGYIFSASLGDSRAILGHLHPVADFSKPKISNKYCRNITCERPFKIFQLTVDQKPENEDEEVRIRKSGGLVHQFTDSFGRNVGPFRVWKKDGAGPGLAMSRSLGDKVAKSCGVSNEPIFISKKIYLGKDQYIVMASDGIWDVMDNIEVINYIDKLRGKCVGNGSDYPANLNNSSIARLVCEEARYRWLGIVQKERVSIDDISCIVIDFAVEVKENAEAADGDKNMITILHNPDMTEAEEAYEADDY